MSTTTTDALPVTEASAVAGMELQRDNVAAMLSSRHAALLAAHQANPSPAHEALVAELALLVRVVQAMPCEFFRPTV